MIADKEGCFATCTYRFEDTKCPDTWVTNNIFAGCFWVGASVPGHECGKPELSRSTGNVAHSIAKSLGGVGIVVTPDYANYNKTCFEGAGIITYKNA